MNKLKHTPGSWEIEEFFDNDEKGYVTNKTYLIYSQKTEDEIVEIKGTDIEKWYNSKLIAAAPEMLGAILLYLKCKALHYFCITLVTFAKRTVGPNMDLAIHYSVNQAHEL